MHQGGVLELMWAYREVIRGKIVLNGKRTQILRRWHQQFQRQAIACQRCCRPHPGDRSGDRLLDHGCHFGLACDIAANGNRLMAGGDQFFCRRANRLLADGSVSIQTSSACVPWGTSCPRFPAGFLCFLSSRCVALHLIGLGFSDEFPVRFCRTFF